MNKLFFFIGKGGVGKSTSSAITAISKAENNKKTLLISLDPAHNLQDIFQCKITDKEYKLTTNLSIIEADIEKETDNYLKTLIRNLKNTYQYQTAFNSQNYFNVLKYSPGIDEYAILQSLSSLVNKFKDKDYLIVDMPPTAISLKFFALPTITLFWLEELLKIRKKINQKKEIISTINFGKKEIETDKVLKQLQKLKETYTSINQLFNSDECNIVLVSNEDILSISEAKRIEKKLTEINLKVSQIIINKFLKKITNIKLTDNFTCNNIVMFPYEENNLIGYEKLHNYIQKNKIETASIN